MNSLLGAMKRRQFHQLLLSSMVLAGVEATANGSFLAELPHSEVSPPTASTGAFKTASNQFSIKFLRSVLASQGDQNHFLSPFSIESALLMTLEGARGQTAAEMGLALAIPDSAKSNDSTSPWQLASVRNDLKEIVKQFYRADSPAEAAVRKTVQQKRAELDKANANAEAIQRKGDFNQAVKVSYEARQLADQINSLSRTIDQYELRNANGLWIDKSFSLRAEYLNIIRSAYDAALENVSFSANPDAEREKINRWISDKTGQKINNIVPAGAITRVTRMVLANAIYFRGTWQDPFDTKQTKPAPFFNQGVRQVEVPMMSKYCESGRYAAFRADGSSFDTPSTLAVGADANEGYPKDGFQVMELGYNGGDLQMWIALPMAKAGLAAMMDTLDAAKIDSWDKALKTRDVQLAIPRFKLEADYDLQSTLEHLGMKSAFDPNSANFSGMSQEAVFISKVLHKSFVDVNEKGTEAAAATIVMMAPAAAAEIPFVPVFIADHPFMFMIRHRPSGTVLFTGVVQRL